MNEEEKIDNSVEYNLDSDEKEILDSVKKEYEILKDSTQKNDTNILNEYGYLDETLEIEVPQEVENNFNAENDVEKLLEILENKNDNENNIEKLEEKFYNEINVKNSQDIFNNENNIESLEENFENEDGIEINDESLEKNLDDDINSQINIEDENQNVKVIEENSLKKPKSYIYSASVKKLDDNETELINNEYTKEEIFVTSDNQRYKIIYTAEESKEKIDYKTYQEKRAFDNYVKKFKPKIKGLHSTIFDALKAVVPIIGIISILLLFFVRISFVDGASMQNTLQDRDVLIVTNFLYEPKVGDIITASHGQQFDEPIIKRVIATQGQSVKIDYEKDVVAVDGVIIDEPYIKEKDMIKSNNDVVDFTIVPKGMVFVMGDNRNNSSDSRTSMIGLIDKNNVIGKAQYVMCPFNRLKYLY